VTINKFPQNNTHESYTINT